MHVKHSSIKGLVVKGLPSQAITGVQVHGSAELVADQTCQQRADTKPFTGRGGLGRFMEASRVVDKLVAEMSALVKVTTDVPGRALYLCLHRRAATGQHSLRWRKAGIPAPHVGWEEFEALVRGFPAEMAQWYRHANRMARDLNAREMEARAALKRAKVQLGSPQRTLREPETVR